MILFDFLSGMKKVGRRRAHAAVPGVALPKVAERVVPAMPAETALQEWLEGVTAALNEEPVEERLAILKRIEDACEASQDARKLEAIRDLRRQLDLPEPPSAAASPSS